MKVYNFLFNNETKSPFLRMFSQTVITALVVFSIVAAPVLVFQNASLKRQVIGLEVQVENDSIFHYSTFKLEGEIDTILPVTKQGIIDAIVELNKQQPSHNELLAFANWAIPAINYYCQADKPKDQDGVLIGTWEDWLEDQKALAAERRQGQQIK